MNQVVTDELQQQQEIEELEPSILGTKSHWDDVYDEEMTNFNEHGVVDEGWFGNDIMEKTLRYIENCKDISKDHRILDLGCGNGSLLLELALIDYTNLTGIDYSEAAIKLAKAVFHLKKFNGEFHVKNILEDDADDLEKFQLCLDKGTFDAISLCENNEKMSQKAARAQYFQYVSKVLKDDGLFILISCNWTTSELVAHSKDLFTLHDEIRTQQFSFGGHAGTLVSIVVLKKLVNQI